MPSVFKPGDRILIGDAFGTVVKGPEPGRIYYVIDGQVTASWIRERYAFHLVPVKDGNP